MISRRDREATLSENRQHSAGLYGSENSINDTVAEELQKLRRAMSMFA